jgi:hypothetical protein
VEIPSLDGTIQTRFDFKREGQEIQVARQGPALLWNILLVGLREVEAVQDVETETVAGDTLIKVPAGTVSLTLRIK